MTEIKKLKDSQVEISGEMEWQEFEKFFDKALDNISKGIELKGFRQGKAPKEMVRAQVGVGKILQEAADLAIRGEYTKILQEKDIEPISAPNAEILKLAEKNPFSFKIKVQILPKIDLPDYKEIAKGIKEKPIEIKEQEIDQTLKFLQRTRAKFEDLETPAQKGDFVNIEYQSPQIEDNKKFSDKFILGEAGFVAGFGENLEAMKKNESKEFSVVFPKDYFKKELQDKKVEFRAKMLNVQKMIVSELNDEFAKQVGNFKTLQELKDNIRKGMEQEKQAGEKRRQAIEVVEKIRGIVKFEVPEAMTKAKEPEDQIRNFLILRAIGKQEKVEITDQEVEKFVQEFLASYPQPEKAKEIDKNQLKEYYRGKLFNEKVLKKLESFL